MKQTKQVEQMQELKKKIKQNYSSLNRKFGVWSKPTKEMRELQQETWEMKRQLEEMQKETHAK